MRVTSLVLGHSWRVLPDLAYFKEELLRVLCTVANLHSARPLLILRDKREAMDTVFAIKQPDAFITNTASALHTPAVPPGAVHSLSRIGKRPRNGLPLVAPSSHRTLYRKLPTEPLWHFCRNCQNWPRAGYEERDNQNPPLKFCRNCLEMHHEERCEWANVELSAARSYRGIGDY
jgi:hypothetical protein